jgi:FtsZ-binding cell division protein ZapB
MNIKGDDTIDNLYTKKLKHFHNTVDIIIPKLNVKIEELENKRNSENKDEINQQIINLKNKIRLLKEEKNKYYLENSKYLFEYFESKQDIDKNINPQKKISNFFKYFVTI